MPQQVTVDVFWARKNVTPSGCWEWTRSLHKDGYGHLNFRGRYWLAHRLAWYLTTDIDPGLSLICHSCDNPPCINPAHLFIGTQADNMADMKRKGRRLGRNLGVNNGRAKLNPDDVAFIRRTYAENRTRQVDLAKQFNVSQGMISAIIRMANWTAA